MEWDLPEPDDLTPWESELQADHGRVVQLGGNGALALEYLRRHPRAQASLITLNRGVQRALRGKRVQVIYLAAPRDIPAPAAGARLFVVEDFSFAPEMAAFVQKSSLARKSAPALPPPRKKRGRPGCTVPSDSRGYARDVDDFLLFLLEDAAYAIEPDAQLVLLGMGGDTAAMLVRSVLSRVELREVHVLECDAESRATARGSSPLVLAPEMETYDNEHVTLALTAANYVGLNLAALGENPDVIAHVRSLFQTGRRRSLSLATFNERPDAPFLPGVPAIAAGGAMRVRFLHDLVAEPLRNPQPDFTDVNLAVERLLPRYELALAPDFPAFTRSLMSVLRAGTDPQALRKLARDAISPAIAALVRCDQRFFHRIFVRHPALVLVPSRHKSARTWVDDASRSGRPPVADLVYNPAYLALGPVSAARPLRDRSHLNTLGLLVSAAEAPVQAHRLHALMFDMFNLIKDDRDALAAADFPAHTPGYVSPFYGPYLRWFAPSIEAFSAFAHDVDWDDTVQDVVLAHASALSRTTLQLVEALPPIR